MTDRKPHPLASAGIFSRFYFTWITPLLEHGGEQTVANQHTLNGLDRCEVMAERLEAALKVRTGRHALAKAIFSSVGGTYWIAGLGRFTWLAAVVGQVLCLGALVRAIRDDDDAWVVALWALAMGALSLAQSVSMSSVFFGSGRGGLRAKAGVSLLIMRKALAISLAGAGSGQASAVTLANNDTQRLVDGLRYSHFLWSSMLELTVVTTLLILDVGFLPALIGAAIIMLVIPIQLTLAKLEGKNHRRAAAQTDTRANLMKEVLSSILFIKISAYEKPFTDRVSAVRAAEVSFMRRSEVLRAINLSLFQAAPLLAGIATFSVYTLVDDNELDAALAFTVLAWLNTLMRTLIMVPRSATALSEMLVSCRRIMAYLALPDRPASLPPPPPSSSSSSPSSPAKPDASTPSGTISINKASFSWSQASNVDGRPSTVLHNIELSVSRGDLVAVVGPSGSGKTSLLLALCGELFADGGDVGVHGGLALSPQRPKLLQASLRANIQFHLPYNPDVMRRVIAAAQLSHDLTDITAFPDGDLTDIGEGGVTLSGGQQARVSIARAFYRVAMAPSVTTLLLDDPLSALDSRVGRQLFNAIAGMKDKTRVMVTHSDAVLPLCDSIVVVEGGSIVAHGTYTELTSRGVNLHTRAEEDGEDGEDGEEEKQPVEETKTDSAGTAAAAAVVENEEEEEEETKPESTAGTTAPPAPTHSDDDPGTASPKDVVFAEEGDTKEGDTTIDKHNADDGSDSSSSDGEFDADAMARKLASTPFPRQLVKAEKQERGGISSDVFRTYVDAAGGVGVAVVLAFLFIIAQTARVWTDAVVALWADDDLDMSNSSYAWLYAGSTVAYVLLVFSRTSLFTLTMLRASRELHDMVLHSIMKAPISFFWRTASANILNKTGRDCDNLDRLLIKSCADMGSFSSLALGAMITVVVVVPWLAPVEIILVIVMYKVTVFWLRAARALKRLEGVTRSPLYDLMGQALSALLSVRVFNVRTVLLDKFVDALNLNISTDLSFIGAQRWLSTRLDLASALVLTGIGLIASSGQFSASLIGLALTQALQTSGVLQFAVRQAGEANSLFTSVERLLEFKEVEGETEDGEDPPPGWPSNGVVKYDSVALRYAEDLEPALTNITFESRANEHIGIVGRTGSGKSSLAMALLRMVPHTGTVTIDGVDTRTLNLKGLRQSISVIPQQPDLFSGTVRFNLDPWSQYTDDDLKAALDSSYVNLSLDTPVTAGGANLSVGERQLVCLARAGLRQSGPASKILFVDEATSSVDGLTDDRVQAALRAHDGTMLVIAHRLQTVTACSRLLVLNPGGTVAEFGSVEDLRGREDGVFAGLEAQA